MGLKVFGVTAVFFFGSSTAWAIFMRSVSAVPSKKSWKNWVIVGLTRCQKEGSKSSDPGLARGFMWKKSCLISCSVKAASRVESAGMVVG